MAQSTHYSTDTQRAKHELRDAASDQLEKVADQVEGAVKTIADRGREVGGEVQAIAGNIKSAVDTSVKEQPMATLAVAAVLGFVMGALWKS